MIRVFGNTTREELQRYRNMPVCRIWESNPHHGFEFTVTINREEKKEMKVKMAILFIKLLLMFGHKRKNAKFDENNCRHLKAN
jgi:hypothetical protein